MCHQSAMNEHYTLSLWDFSWLYPARITSFAVKLSFIS
jgi:hypothetical protein